MTAHAPVAAGPTDERSHPPVTQLAIASLALVLIGGIYMVATFADKPSLALPVVLLAGSAIIWATSVLLLTRHRGFAWPVFLQVARWALLAYATIASMIEYSFIHNHVSGTPLLVLSLMLVMFAVDVPLAIGFTVARFQAPSCD